MRLYTENHRSPKGPEGVIDHARCFDACEVVKETRTHLHVMHGGRLVKIRRDTMISIDAYLGSRRWYMEESMPDILWDRANRSRIRRAVEAADVATLRRVDAALGGDHG